MTAKALNDDPTLDAVGSAGFFAFQNTVIGCPVQAETASAPPTSKLVIKSNTKMVCFENRPDILGTGTVSIIRCNEDEIGWPSDIRIAD
jgi:hypothetical protein